MTEDDVMQVALIEAHLGRSIPRQEEPAPESPEEAKETENREAALLNQALRVMESMRRTEPSLKERERQAVIDALERTHYVQKDAAKILGITPMAMNRRIKAMGIDWRGMRRGNV